jgi:hypothetical protein
MTTRVATASVTLAILVGLSAVTLQAGGFLYSLDITNANPRPDGTCRCPSRADPLERAGRASGW